MPVAPDRRPSPILLEVARYVAYAEAFGWTPDEVDDLPLDVEPHLIPVLTLLREVRGQ